MDAEIKTYISNRYERWLDYANFHSNRAGIDDQAIDILNEVMISLLEKEHSKIERLYNTREEKYRELDFFVLRMIKLNVYSPTSPYQNKYKPIPANTEIDYRKLNIIDSEEEETDHAGYIFDRMQEIRELIESMYFSERAMAIFEYRFFEDGNIKDWPGPEKPKEIYSIYKRIKTLITKKINGEILV